MSNYKDWKLILYYSAGFQANEPLWVNDLYYFPFGEYFLYDRKEQSTII